MPPNRENSSSASFYGSKLGNPSSGSKVTTILVKVKSKKKRDIFVGILEIRDFYHDGNHMRSCKNKRCGTETHNVIFFDVTLNSFDEF